MAMGKGELAEQLGGGGQLESKGGTVGRGGGIGGTGRRVRCATTRVWYSSRRSMRFPSSPVPAPAVVAVIFFPCRPKRKPYYILPFFLVGR